MYPPSAGNFWLLCIYYNKTRIVSDLRNSIKQLVLGGN